MDRIQKIWKWYNVCYHQIISNFAATLTHILLLTTEDVVGDRQDWSQPYPLLKCVVVHCVASCWLHNQWSFHLAYIGIRKCYWFHSYPQCNITTQTNTAKGFTSFFGVRMIVSGMRSLHPIVGNISSMKWLRSQSSIVRRLKFKQVLSYFSMIGVIPM